MHKLVRDLRRPQTSADPPDSTCASNNNNIDSSNGRPHILRLRRLHRGDNAEYFGRLPADKFSAAWTSEGTEEVFSHRASQSSPYGSMSFEDEVQQAKNAIEGLSRTQLRNRFPYMKIEALEELLAETADVIVSRLVEQ